MSWQPSEENLQQLVQVLAQSASSDGTLRAQARRALEEARHQSDLDKYLTYLLVTNRQDTNPELRATAGLLLKNNIRIGFEHSAPDVIDYIKANVLKGLLDPSNLIRNITGNVITTLLAKSSVTGWPEVMGQLMNMAEAHTDLVGRESAVSALAKICEDSASELDRDYNGQRPLDYMVPKFLEFTRSSSTKIRSQSIFCLTQFIAIQSNALLQQLDAFLNTLFSLASEADPDTRRNICSALVVILEVRPDKLLPHLDGVVDFCLHCIKDEDETVASEACEFILGLAESQIDQAIVTAYLPKILPVILSTMVFSEMDRFILESRAEDDEAVEDRAEDLKPTFASSKDAHNEKKRDASGSMNATESTKNGGGGTSEKNGDDEEDDDDDDDDDDIDAELAEWNLRKCSAAALDTFASKYPEIVLTVIMPYLKQNIVSNEWHVREAAILAFGAVAEGGMKYIEQYLPSLVPFLVDRLNDEQAPVRQITCWTLGRFASWIVETTNNGSNNQQFFLPVLEGLLKCCLDKNKRTQESGCSAFAGFCEVSGELLVPYLEEILSRLMLCLHKYQAKNMVVLYDAIQTLVDSVGSAMSENPKYAQMILPPLIEKWGKLKDDDRELWPLQECLSSITASLGDIFAPYSPSMFERCIRILQTNLIMDQNYSMDPSIDPPEKDFIITTLDLLDGLVQGLGHNASPLIEHSNPSLVEMMLVCFKDVVYEVRQSAFALLGDMAISTFDRLRPYLGNIMQSTISQIDVADENADAVCNNAIWSVGELALRASREELEPYSTELLQRLVTTLQSHSNLTVLENAAITIGRLGQKLADIMSPHLEVFIRLWCEKIRQVDETDEKDSAFLGMCHIISGNPNALTNDPTILVEFLELCSLYNDPSPQLAMLIANILDGYKKLLGDNWITVTNRLHPSVAQALGRYGV